MTKEFLRITLTDGAVYILPTQTIVAIKIYRGNATNYDNHEIDFSKIENIEITEEKE
jgi:hypothetical protein